MAKKKKTPYKFSLPAKTNQAQITTQKGNKTLLY